MLRACMCSAFIIDYMIEEGWGQVRDEKRTRRREAYVVCAGDNECCAPASFVAPWSMQPPTTKLAGWFVLQILWIAKPTFSEAHTCRLRVCAFPFFQNTKANFRSKSFHYTSCRECEVPILRWKRSIPQLMILLAWIAYGKFTFLDNLSKYSKIKSYNFFTPYWKNVHKD